jgi:hypothetical protein
MVDHTQKYEDNYRDIEKTVMKLDEELYEAYSDHKRKMDGLKSEAGDLCKHIAGMWLEGNSLYGETGKAYKQVIKESIHYGDSVKSIEDQRKTIDEYNETKKNWVDSINAIKESFNKMQISLDIAESIPSFISERDMKIKEL